MKRGLKTFTASVLAVSFTLTAVSTSFAQTYSSKYSTKNKSGSSYNLNKTYSQYQPSYYPPLKGGVVTIPVGTSIPAVTTSTISSEYLTPGDTVSIVLPSDFYFSGVLVAPANSMVNGNVVIGEKAGLAGKHGKLKIRFTNISTPTGQRIPISGKILTDDGTGLLVGGTTKDRAITAVKNVAIGSGVGALAGTILGPLSGGKVGRGAAMGTAVGGGLALGKTVIDKGQNVTIEPNTPIEIILDQSANVAPSQQEY